MFEPQNLFQNIMTLIMSPFVIIVLVLILVMARSVYKARASARWPATSGRVLSARVSARGDLHGSTMYEPNVWYEYDVGGQAYRCSEISYGGRAAASSPDWAEQIVTRFPAGAEVEVFYNPARPEEAILEHGHGTVNVVIMAALILVELMLVGLIVWTQVRASSPG